MANPASRAQFIRHVCGYLRSHNFDGLDVDWEYPGARGSGPADRENFVAFIKVQYNIPAGMFDQNMQFNSSRILALFPYSVNKKLPARTAISITIW